MLIRLDLRVRKQTWGQVTAGEEPALLATATGVVGCVLGSDATPGP